MQVTKSKKIKLIVLSLLCGFLTMFFINSIQTQRNLATAQNALTFDTTQAWDPFYKQFTSSINRSEPINLPAPPQNASTETQNELQRLKDYQRLRTPEKVEEIKKEIFLDNAYFGEYIFSEIIASSTRPYTHQLFAELAQYEIGIIFNEKEKFNRVRPSFLDTSLPTAIEVPAHPSYPSGHATQAYLRAHVLSSLDPDKRDIYFTAALRIATNREIAGVHYPSDSKAGEMLAEQIFTILMRDEIFLSQLTLSKTEW